MNSDRSILFLSFGELDKTSSLRATQLVLELRKLGWNARIAVPDSNWNREIGQLSGLEPEYFNPRLRAFVGSVRTIIKKISPHFIHLLNPKEKGAILAISFPQFRFVFDWEDWSTFWESRRVAKWYKQRRESWLVKRASLVVTASQWLQDYIHRQFGRKPLYLPYACMPTPLECSTQRKTFDPSLPAVAVGMGNLYPSWDHDLLVEAAGILKQRGQEKTLRWIGTGIDFENTRQRIQALKLERFELTGYLQLDAMNQQLRQSHCLVFPIRNKPLNLARCPFKCYQFAQAARPVITSDVGEVRAILGDLAIYVDPTPEGLADALSRVLEEPRREDIEYDLSNHRWEYRAKTLSEALLRMQ